MKVFGKACSPYFICTRVGDLERVFSFWIASCMMPRSLPGSSEQHARGINETRMPTAIRGNHEAQGACCCLMLQVLTGSLEGIQTVVPAFFGHRETDFQGQIPQGEGGSGLGRQDCLNESGPLKLFQRCQRTASRQDSNGLAASHAQEPLGGWGSWGDGAIPETGREWVAEVFDLPIL